MADAEPSRTTMLPKACENCRVRKIRCDKGAPCSSCQMVNLPCRTAHSTTRRPDTHRHAASTYHEKQFNLIHESLQDIKDRLRGLDLKQSAMQPATDVAVVAGTPKSQSTPETFLGESSFDCHSEQASLSAEASARDVQAGTVGQQLGASLTLLKSILRNQDRSSSTNDLAFPRSTFEPLQLKAELPPVAAVLAALKRATAHTPFVLLHSAQRDHAILENLCRKVYFPAKPYSKGEITLMNGMLSFVFAEYSATPDSTLTAADCMAYAKLCETNFIAGLQDYECLVTPTLENIQCLMIGAMKAQEESRPSLCWTFVSAGARLCQTLGYHREAVVARDPPRLAEAKRHAFWMLYMIDKTLSLNLGRPSCFPDYDTDVNVFSPTADPRFRPWDHAFIAFIEFSKLQGRIYDDLYSSRAQKETPENRSKVVEELSGRFFDWHLDFKQIKTAGSHDQNDLDLIVGSSDFIYYSALNLLYGAKVSPGSATHISSQRYEAARLSLQCHIRSSSKLSATDKPKWRIYSDWSSLNRILLYSSFTPFLVVFTHALASHSSEDVILLTHVLNTLEAPRQNTEALNRLYQVCRVFLDFARTFVPLQKPSFGFYNQEDDSFTFPELGESAPDGVSGSDLKGGEYPHEMEGFGENGDLDSMSAFLGTCLGENSAMNGLWNIDFSSSQWM